LALALLFPPTDSWRPDSFYDRILANRRAGLHTLCLLDIKVKEPSLESLARGRKVYEPPRFMSVGTALRQLLEIEAARGQGAYSGDTLCVGVARLGSDSQQIVAGSMQQLLEVEFGPPLHSLVIAGDTHPIEQEYLQQFMTCSSAGASSSQGATETAGASM
jgi:diphthine synthase